MGSSGHSLLGRLTLPGEPGRAAGLPQDLFCSGIPGGRYGVRMGQFQRVVTDAKPVCPAAAPVAEAAGGTGCVCRVTSDLIDSATDPSTLNRYCFNEPGYQACSTWRADRDEYLATRLVRDLLTPKGDRTTGHPEDRERNRGLEIAREAQERGQWLAERGELD